MKVSDYTCAGVECVLMSDIPVAGSFILTVKQFKELYTAMTYFYQDRYNAELLAACRDQRREWEREAE